MMFEIKEIPAAQKDDINIPNEPFSMKGKLAVSYADGAWSYRAIRFDPTEWTEMCFPDEGYDYDKMKQNAVFLGAYDGDRCIGLAILRDAPFRYMYLYDLKVCGSYRRHGVAAALIRKAKEICLQRNYLGIYTQGQDNNLSACLFYLKTGFYIGGLDTNVYKGTRQEGKSDVLFYLDCK